MLKVGYIGLGLMGKSIARNILKAGFTVIVHNRSHASVDELVAEGPDLHIAPGFPLKSEPFFRNPDRKTHV